MIPNDVCDFLNVNPDVKAMLWDVIQKLCEYVPVYPPDAVHAAARVVVNAGELMRGAMGINALDNVDSRENLLEVAINTAAQSLRFLAEIGNLKSRELPE